MNRSDKIIKLKLDIIFKRVFGDSNNKEIISAFLEALLEMPRNSIQDIIIENVELPPNELDKKFSRLDLKMLVDNKIVNIEMQVNYEADFKDRTLFYWSKIYSDELGSGDEYGELKKTVCINIINFNALKNQSYHSHFISAEKETGEILSDKFDIHFFKLKKIKNSARNKPMEDWLNLINAETEGELMDIETNTQIKEVRDTIVILRELNADDKLKQEVYYREKRLHDEASALGSARREGIAEGEAKKEAELIERWRKKGFSEKQIKELLGDD